MTTSSRPRARVLAPLAYAMLLSVSLLAGPALAQDNTTATTPATDAAATPAPADATAAPADAAATPANAAAPADAAAPAPAASPDTVLATVGGETITEGDLSFVADDLGQDMSSVPEDQRRAFLLTVMIDMKLMAQAARQAGLDQGAQFQRQLTYLQDRALRRAYTEKMISPGLTPDAVQKAYTDYVASYTPEQEVKASHILVATEDEAKAVKAQIEGGADFATVAKEKSIDPSAASNGGDLGYFTKEQMVPTFADAAFALDIGKVSDPVQSQFGWHIIKVEDKRQSPPPALADIGPQLQQQLMIKSYNDAIAGLKNQIKVEIPDPALATAVQAQTQEGQ